MAQKLSLRQRFYRWRTKIQTDRLERQAPKIDNSPAVGQRVYIHDDGGYNGYGVISRINSYGIHFLWVTGFSWRNDVSTTDYLKRYQDGWEFNFPASTY